MVTVPLRVWPGPGMLICMIMMVLWEWEEWEAVATVIHCLAWEVDTAEAINIIITALAHVGVMVWVEAVILVEDMAWAVINMSIVMNMIMADQWVVVAEWDSAIPTTTMNGEQLIDNRYQGARSSLPL